MPATLVRPDPAQESIRELAQDIFSHIIGILSNSVIAGMK